MSTKVDSIVLPKNPFPGLRAYNSEEKILFHGRERQLDELLRKLRTSRFLAIVGTGGSGKSSMVRASLIPRLQEGFSGQGGEQWRIAVCTPGNKPIENLSKSLAQRGVLHPDDIMDPNFPAVIENTLRRGSYGIVEAFKEAFKQAGVKENLMVVVDQFEELFQNTGGKKKGRKNKEREKEADAFVNLLLSACRQKDVPIYIVITLRSSYLGACTEFRGLPEIINDGQFLIPRMKVEDLKRAIIAPIESPEAKKYSKTDPTIERELVNHIISDLGEDIDQLSVLQHTMMRMWYHWENKSGDNLSEPLTKAHYDAVGGINAAMSRHAEEAYRELVDAKVGADGNIVSKDDTKAVLCEKMFRALSEKGADGKPVRRAIPVKEIMRITDGNLSDVRKTIYAFSSEDRQFLAAPPIGEIDEDSTVYIAHESLMEKWETLREWMDKETESADIYLRMAAAAAAYYEGKGGLWSDPELSMGLNWYNTQTPNAAWAERYNPAFFETIEFLKESEAKNKEVLAAGKMEQEQRVKRASLVAIGSVLFGIICILLFGLSLFSMNKANRSAAEARRSAQESKRQTYLAELNKQEARRQEFEASRAAARAEAEKTKAESATLAAIESSNFADKQAKEALNQKARAEDALLLAKQREEEALAAKDKADAAARKAQEEEKKAKEAETAARKAKGLSLAQSVAVKSQELEDEITQGLLAKEAYSLNSDNSGKPHDAFIYKGLYAAMNKLQAKIGVGKGANPNFNALNQTPPGYDRIGAVRAMRVSKDNSSLYSTGSDGFLLKWALPENYYECQKDRDANLPEELAKPQSKVYRALDISPDGKYLVRGGDNSKVEIYELQSKRLVEANPHKGSRVWAVAFMPDGKGFVSSGGDGSIQYTTISGENTPVVPLLPEGIDRVTSLAISSDGRFLAGAGTSSEVWIWNQETGQVFKKLATEDDKESGRVATSVAFGGRDDRFIAVGFQDGSLRIWDLLETDPMTGQVKTPEKLKYHSAKINDVEFSKDGTMLAVGSLDKSATLWQIQSRSNRSDFPYKDPKFLPIRLDDHKAWVMSVTFTNDGQKMITGCEDGVVKYWETDMSFYAEEICKIAQANLSDKNWRKYIGTDDKTNKQLYINTAKGSGFERTPISTCFQLDPDGKPIGPFQQEAE